MRRSVITAFALAATMLLNAYPVLAISDDDESYAAEFIQQQEARYESTEGSVQRIMAETRESFGLMAVDGWSKTESNGSVEINSDNTSFVLTCNGSRFSTATVTANSPVIEGLTDNSILEFNFKINLNNVKEGIVGLVDEAEAELALLTAKSGVLTFPDLSTAEVDADTDIKVSARIDFKKSKAVICVDADGDGVLTDDEALYSGTVTLPETESMGVFLKNELVRTAGTSVLKISDYSVEKLVRLGVEGLYFGNRELSNGSSYSVEEISAGIMIKFVGEAADEIYSSENYSLYKDNVLITDSENKIVPQAQDGGVLLNLSLIDITAGEYKLVIDKITDALTGDESEISHEYTFGVVPQGYIYPSITVESPETVYYGETAELVFHADGSHWDKVVVYINNEEYGTYEQEDFTVFLRPEEGDEYHIKATISDTVGNSAETTATLNVLDNTAPTVSFSNAESGRLRYSVEDVKIVTVSADDVDGEIAYIELYVNGVLKKTVEAAYESFDFDELDCGIGTFALKAVAYDNHGLSGEHEISVTVSSQFMELIYENSAFDSINPTINRGYARVETVDEAKGNSLVMGMDDESSTAVKNDYTSVNFSKFAELVMYQFDVNVRQAPNGTGVSLALRHVDSTNAVTITSLFSVQKDVFKAGAGTLPYEIGKWYRVSVTVSFSDTAKWYSVKVDENVLCQETYVNFHTPSLWRFHTGTNQTDRYRVALDNMEIYEIIETPEINAVGYDEIYESTEIPYDASVLNVMLSGSLKREDLSPDTIRVSRKSEEVLIDSVVFNSSNNCVAIKLGEKLVPNTEYEIIFDKSIRIGDDRTLGDELKAKFQTAVKDVDVTEAKWIPRRNGTAQLEFQTENVGTQTVKIYAVVSLWNRAGRFVACYAKEFDVAALGGTQTFRMNIDDTTAAGSRAEIYFPDELGSGGIYKTAIFE